MRVKPRTLPDKSRKKKKKKQEFQKGRIHFSRVHRFFFLFKDHLQTGPVFFFLPAQTQSSRLVLVLLFFSLVFFFSLSRSVSLSPSFAIFVLPQSLLFPCEWCCELPSFLPVLYRVRSVSTCSAFRPSLSFLQRCFSSSLFSL